ncbi:hypothetical protein [Caenispirillum bisanense]|uniref:hypothetical protein n=1 Tax=Caenispirillum bisanense TaxID=414052 RepID=UPI0031DE4F49
MTRKELKARWMRLARPTRLSLIALAAAAVGGVVLVGGGQYALSELEMVEQRLRGQLGGVQAETAQLRDDIAFVTDNTERYEAFLARGMFADRNRLAARRAVEMLVRNNRLQADIAVRPEGRRVPADPVLAENFRIIDTPIDVRAGAILDSDLAAFMRDMPTALPGFLVLQRARLERVPAVTAEHLRDLRNGLPVELVQGQLIYGWRSAEAVRGQSEETPQ